jgi:hypothetical protein
MNIGVSYTANQDFLYTGLIERPETGGNNLQTDAVVAWGCQDQPNNVDNLRFLFLEGTFDPTDQGLETMRITPQGNVGIGSSYTNAIQPPRRLSVHRTGLFPQFRISHSIAVDPNFGRHADFQIDNSGFLFIRPSEANTTRSVAIGFLDGQLTDPTLETRLDVGGLTRIRQLPDSLKDCLIIGTNASANAEDNYLTRLDFTGNPDEYLAGDGTWQNISGGGTDLDWETDGTDVWTGHGLNGYPPGDVMIGVTPPGYNAKLSLFEEADTPNRTGARIRVERLSGALGTTRGLLVELTDLPNSGINTGVEALVRSGKINIGGSFTVVMDQNQSDWSAGAAGYGFASSTDVNFDIIGLYGFAENGSNTGTGPVPNFPIGVYGEALYTGSTPTTSIAGHFQGTVQQLFPAITLSDEGLKSNIQPINGADELLSQLNPVSYNYDMESQFGISTEEMQSNGFLAQELQEVFPDAVSDFYVPERRDTAGVVTRERSLHLGVKYDEFIPVLVSGHQFQDSLINAQNELIQFQNNEMALLIQGNEALTDQVAELSQQLTEQAVQMEALQEQMNNVITSLQASQTKMNNCCGTPQEKKQSETGMIELEQNFPNPFESVTTINYSTSYAAQIRLDISDSQGRVLEVIVNQKQEAGEYRVQWDASEFSPGTYYYSLYADTELLTKKMIKK